jgi:hypothetical protein
MTDQERVAAMVRRVKLQGGIKKVYTALQVQETELADFLHFMYQPWYWFGRASFEATMISFLARCPEADKRRWDELAS